MLQIHGSFLSLILYLRFVYYSLVTFLMMRLPIMLMITVTTNNINPNSTNAEKYNVWSASVNSLAITLAIVLPGPKMMFLNESPMALVFPITIVTAIVSPNALPSDNKT